MLLRKKALIISVICIFTGVLAITLLLINTPKKKVIYTHNSETSSSTDVTVNIPENLSEISSDVRTEDLPTNTISIDINDSLQNETNNEKTTPAAEKSVTTKQPSQENINNGNEIKIGNEAPLPDNRETNAFLENLKAKGCPYCGKHDCISFFAKDQWGNPCYTPSKCPMYDITKDPVHYCQECGKKTGDGRNDTCTQFVNACFCPNCGEWVPSRTCHTCK